jgi:hypothetical protein
MPLSYAKQDAEEEETTTKNYAVLFLDFFSHAKYCSL